MVMLNPKEADSKLGTSGTDEVVVSGDLWGWGAQGLCQPRSHYSLAWVVAVLDWSRGGAESLEYANFLPLIGREPLGEESDDSSTPHLPGCTSPGSGWLRSTSLSPGQRQGFWTVTWGPGRPPSPGLGLLAPVGLCPQCRPGGRVGGCGQVEPPCAPGCLAVRPRSPRPGSWRSGARPG